MSNRVNVSMQGPVPIFCSYASADAKYLDELLVHLAILREDGLIAGFEYRQIAPGDEWPKRIEEKLDAASIVLLLLSASFFDSRYCREEMQRALDRREAGTVVIPVILKRCDWKSNDELRRLNALPPGAQPIVRDGRSRDEGWQEVVEGIRKVIDARRPVAPPRSRHDGPRDDDAARKLTDSLINALPRPFIKGDVDDVGLYHILRLDEPLPPVFYHWRVRHEAVHWVDFAHMLLFRRIADLGFPINFLVDDYKQNIAPERAREITEPVVRAMFDEDEADIRWFADTYEHRAKYAKEAEEKGFGLYAEERLTKAIRTKFDIKTHAEHWLRVIIHVIGDDDRCVLCVWHRQRKMYDVLRAARRVQPVLILRPDFTIGGALGKSAPPGSGLVIEPPVYPTILRWLGEESNPRETRELAKYLTLNESETKAAPPADTLDRSAQLLQAHPALGARLAKPGCDRELERGALWLLDAMLRWNASYFKPPTGG